VIGQRRERRTLNVELPTLKEEGTTYRIYDLEERLLEYAASIIRLVERLPAMRAGNHIAAQLLRSGTSPLPNHAEAQAAESRNDFIHKLKICLKELRESLRWLKLMKRVPLLQPPSQVDALLAETEALVKIFVAGVRTAAAKNGRPSPVGRSKFNVGRSELNSSKGGGQ
jgi:four helix bundle protein